MNMFVQDPRMRPSCYEIMRLTEILLAQAKRRSENKAGQPSGSEPQSATQLATHLRRFSSEGMPEKQLM
jgi:hypothetical protein